MKMIPKKLHQIWIGEMPDYIRNDLETTKNLFDYYGWEYKLWTIDELIEFNYLSDFLVRYLIKNSKNINLTYTMLANIASYGILYKEGGFYVDTNVVFNKIIPSSLLKHSFVASYGDKYYVKDKNMLINNIFGSEKRNYILCTLLNYINNIIVNNLSLLQKIKPWKITGLLPFTNVVETFAEFDKSILLLESEYFCPFKNGEEINLNKLSKNNICYFNHNIKN